MHNITQKVVGTKLMLEIDLSPTAQKSAQPSATGKTLLLASTHGAREVVANITYSLNVMLRRTA